MCYFRRTVTGTRNFRKSVTSVLNNLNKDKYNISTIGITKNGAWYLYTGDYAKIESGEWEQDTENKKKAILSPVQRISYTCF